MSLEGTLTTAEGEGMGEPGIPLLARATGSTGSNPLMDGTMRAMVIALPATALAFVHVEFGFLSVEGFASAEAALAPAGLILWAIFDRYIKPRLLAP